VVHRYREERGGRNLSGRPGSHRYQLRGRQGVRHQLDDRFHLRVRYEDAEAGGPDQDRQQLVLADGDHGRGGPEALSWQRYRQQHLHHRRPDRGGRARRERRPIPVGHAHHGQQGQLLPLRLHAPGSSSAASRRGRRAFAVATLYVASTFANREAAAQDNTAAPPAEPTPHASDVRANTRLFRRGGTTVSEEQASELTLTLTEAAVRPIQTWVRTAGALDDSSHGLTA